MSYLGAYMEDNAIPFYEYKLSAGFPSPAEAWSESRLNLHDHLIHKPAATFFVRVDGDSMIGAGIFKGDLLIVDRSLEARNNSIVVAVINSEFTLKRLILKNGIIKLRAENPNYPEVKITENMNFAIWGVAIHNIHDLRHL